jgi:hypothetical protein
MKPLEPFDPDDERRLRERIRGVMMAAYLQARQRYADACEATEGALPRGCPLDPYPSDAGHGLGGLQSPP